MLRRKNKQQCLNRCDNDFVWCWKQCEPKYLNQTRLSCNHFCDRIRRVCIEKCYRGYSGVK